MEKRNKIFLIISCIVMMFLLIGISIIDIKADETNESSESTSSDVYGYEFDKSISCDITDIVNEIDDYYFVSCLLSEFELTSSNVFPEELLPLCSKKNVQDADLGDFEFVPYMLFFEFVSETVNNVEVNLLELKAVCKGNSKNGYFSNSRVQAILGAWVIDENNLISYQELDEIDLDLFVLEYDKLFFPALSLYVCENEMDNWKGTYVLAESVCNFFDVFDFLFIAPDDKIYENWELLPSEEGQYIENENHSFVNKTQTILNEWDVIPSSYQLLSSNNMNILIDSSNSNIATISNPNMFKIDEDYKTYYFRSIYPDEISSVSDVVITCYDENKELLGTCEINYAEDNKSFSFTTLENTCYLEYSIVITKLSTSTHIDFEKRIDIIFTLCRFKSGDYTYYAQGKVVDAISNLYTKNYIRVRPNTEYVFFISTSIYNLSSIVIKGYTIDQNFVKNLDFVIDSEDSKKVIFTVPENIEFIKLDVLVSHSEAKGFSLSSYVENYFRLYPSSVESSTSTYYEPDVVDLYSNYLVEVEFSYDTVLYLNTNIKTMADYILNFMMKDLINFAGPVLVIPDLNYEIDFSILFFDSFQNLLMSSNVSELSIGTSDDYYSVNLDWNINQIVFSDFLNSYYSYFLNDYLYDFNFVCYLNKAFSNFISTTPFENVDYSIYEKDKYYAYIEIDPSFDIESYSEIEEYNAETLFFDYNNTLAFRDGDLYWNLDDEDYANFNTNIKYIYRTISYNDVEVFNKKYEGKMILHVEEYDYDFENIKLEKLVYNKKFDDVSEIENDYNNLVFYKLFNSSFIADVSAVDYGMCYSKEFVSPGMTFSDFSYSAVSFIFNGWIFGGSEFVIGKKTSYSELSWEFISSEDESISLENLELLYTDKAKIIDYYFLNFLLKYFFDCETYDTNGETINFDKFEKIYLNKKLDNNQIYEKLSILNDVENWVFSYSLNDVIVYGLKIELNDDMIAIYIYDIYAEKKFVPIWSSCDYTLTFNDVSYTFTEGWNYENDYILHSKVHEDESTASYMGYSGLSQLKSVMSSTPYSETSSYNISIEYDSNGGYFTESNNKISDTTIVANISDSATLTWSQSDLDRALEETIGQGGVARDGYTFLGWSTSSTDTTVDEEITLQDDRIYLYAIWEKETTETIYNVKITFDPNGGYFTASGSRIDDTSVIYSYETTTNPDGTTFTQSELDDILEREIGQGGIARDGYTLLGWTYSSPTETTVKDSLTMQGDEMVVYAIWNANKYTIKFLNEDGTLLDKQTLAYGETPVYSGTTPTKNSTSEYSYVFSGWNPSIVAVSGDATYKATYTIKTYSIQIEYDANGGYFTESNNKISDKTIVANITDSTSLTWSQSTLYQAMSDEIGQGDVERYGYTFLGWSTSSTATSVNNSITLQDDRIYLYAVWEKSPYNFTINYDANGGYFKGDELSVISVDFGSVKDSVISLNQTSLNDTLTSKSLGNTALLDRDGYIFVGWSDNISSQPKETYEYTPEYPDTELTFYAIWKKVPKIEYSYKNEDQIYYFDKIANQWEITDVVDITITFDGKEVDGTIVASNITEGVRADNEYYFGGINIVRITFNPTNTTEYSSVSCDIEFEMYYKEQIEVNYKLYLRLANNNQELKQTLKTTYKAKTEFTSALLNSYLEENDLNIICYSVSKEYGEGIVGDENGVENIDIVFTYDTKFIYNFNMGTDGETNSMIQDISDSWTIQYLDSGKIMYYPKSKPTAVRENYNFLGWYYIDDDTESQFSANFITLSEPTEVIYLVAKWEYGLTVETSETFKKIIDATYTMKNSSATTNNDWDSLIAKLSVGGKVEIVFEDEYTTYIFKEKGNKICEKIRFENNLTFLNGKTIEDAFYLIETVDEEKTLMIEYLLANNEYILYYPKTGMYLEKNYITLSSRDFAYLDNDDVRQYYLYFNSDIDVDHFTMMKFNYKYEVDDSLLLSHSVEGTHTVFDDSSDLIYLTGQRFNFNPNKLIEAIESQDNTNFEEGSYSINGTTYKYRMRFMAQEIYSTGEILLSWTNFYWLADLSWDEQLLSFSVNNPITMKYLDPLEVSYILNGTEVANIKVYDKVNIGTEEPGVDTGEPVDLTEKVNPFNFVDFFKALVEVFKDFSLVKLIGVFTKYYGCTVVIFGGGFVLIKFYPIVKDVVSAVFNIVKSILSKIFGK